jgi:hypothetical protein
MPIDTMCYTVKNYSYLAIITHHGSPIKGFFVELLRQHSGGKILPWITWKLPRRGDIQVGSRRCCRGSSAMVAEEPRILLCHFKPLHALVIKEFGECLPEVGGAGIPDIDQKVVGARPAQGPA